LPHRPSGGGWQTILLSSLIRASLAMPVAGYSSFATRPSFPKWTGDLNTPWILAIRGLHSFDGNAGAASVQITTMPATTAVSRRLCTGPLAAARPIFALYGDAGGCARMPI
jgi:hypothetical protein